MGRALLIGVLLVFVRPQGRPSELRVLQVTPASATLPTDAVTITFDRPVVGYAGDIIDPARVASVRPALPVRFDWRNPSTLRLIPSAPWPAGQVVTVTIDTTLVAPDGSRLTSPLRIPIRVTGPARRGAVPELHATQRAHLPPDGRLRLLYTSAVDVASLGRIARIEFGAAGACGSRIVRLGVTQRSVAPDDYAFAYALGYDSARKAMGRVVELAPPSPLPADCDGKVIVPSLDSIDAPEISYAVRSSPDFAFHSLRCDQPQDCAASGSIALTFTLPVQVAAARRAIRVDGAPATIVDEGYTGANWVTLRFSPQTRQVHRITIDSSLTDVAGRRLTGPREVVLSVGDRAPRVTHAYEFLTLPRGSTPFIRVRHVNVDSAELEVLRLRPNVAHLLGERQGLVWDGRSFSRRVVALAGSRNEERSTDVALPELVTPPTQLLAVRIRLRRGQPDIVRSEVATSRSRTSITIVDTMTSVPAIVQSSNLSVHARIDEDHGAVMVMDSRRGTPVANAAVSMNGGDGSVFVRARTDSSGVAIITIPGVNNDYTGSRPSRVIEVTYQGDRVLLPVALDSRNQLDAAAGGAIHQSQWTGPFQGRRGLLFTDRDLYRPGERVFLGALARIGRIERLRVPTGADRFRYHVYGIARRNGNGVVFERDIAFSQFGTSADSFNLDPRAIVGPYFAELQVLWGTRWLALSQVRFDVAEYRAPEFTVNVAGDSVPRYVGDLLTWRVSGRYLYDAPMRRSAVRWGAAISEASPWDLRIPVPSGFGFGDPADAWEGPPRIDNGWRLSGTATLDSMGRAVIRMADTIRQAGTFRMTFSTSVEDVNRQTVTSSSSQLLFGSGHYFAMREMRGARRSWWWQPGDPVRFEVLAVRPDGSRAVAENITARLVHSRWVDSSGTFAYGRWVPDTIATWPLVSADTAIPVSFTPRGGGYYTLQLLGRDRAGRPVESRIRRFVFADGGRSPIDGPVTRLVIETDSIQHKVGSTATLRFNSPFPSADAWVTVERDGLLTQFRQPARQGPNEVSIAVNATMAPAALVGVVLLNRAPGAAGDSTHFRLRVGLERLWVDSLVKQLVVTVAPEKREVEPGADARMNLQVKNSDGRGARAAVTVWAVDAGVLSMGDYERPNPFETLHTQHIRWLAFASTVPSTLFMYHPRRLAQSGTLRRGLSAMAFSSNRLSEVVITGVGAERLDMLGRGVQGGAMDRVDFRTTAFFRSMAVTDDSGHATVNVRLPDNIATYRLFAVAIGADDRSGSAESTFVATRPLVVRAALPRFVRPGDVFTAGAVIGARDGRARDVQVTAEGTGITLREAPATTVRLDDASAEARFSWTAREGDSARVRLSASDGTNRDAVRVSIPVKPDRFPLARAISGVVRNTQTVRLAIPKEIDLSRSRLTIRAGTTPLPLIDEALEYVAGYSYACTEQLLATGRVLAAALALQRAGLPVKVERRRAITTLDAIVDELSKRQRSDGAFGYWSSNSWSTPWLSSAVGHLIADAAAAGVQVHPQMVENLTRYLEQSLSRSFNPDTASGTRLERRQTAFSHYGERLAAADYLRRAGKPQDIEEHALLQRESLLAWEDRVLLARLLRDAGRTAEAGGLLQRAWRAVGTAGIRADLPDSLNGRGLFPSRVRPLARLVEATVAIDPTNERLGTVLERLVSRTSSGGQPPWNTQDYATASSAVLAAMQVLPRGTGSLTATVGPAANGVARRFVLRTTDGAATDSTIDLTNAAQLEGDSLVVRVGLVARNGPIFWALTTSEVSSTPDTRPVANGVTVERWYERFDNGERATEVREGDLVRVRVRVTVPNQRDFLAVEDPLPAGLEAVDLSLRTSGLGPFRTDDSEEARARRDREAAAGRSLGSWDSGWWSPWEHSEKRDDRVTWFARSLMPGVYTASYVARATTSGRFVRPPSRAEEMYNAAAGGRSEGGVFVVTQRP